VLDRRPHELPFGRRRHHRTRPAPHPPTRHHQPQRRGRTCQPTVGTTTIPTQQAHHRLGPRHDRCLRAHRELVGGRARDLVFTSPGGTRGPGGQLSSANFARVWQRALSAAGLDQAGPDQERPHFHDLRHTHAVWLLAQQTPIGAIARRLGHANPVVTMRMYQHAATLVAEDQLTTRSLGLTTHRRPR